MRNTTHLSIESPDLDYIRNGCEETDMDEAIIETYTYSKGGLQMAKELSEILYNYNMKLPHLDRLSNIVWPNYTFLGFRGSFKASNPIQVSSASYYAPSIHIQINVPRYYDWVIRRNSLLRCTSNIITNIEIECVEAVLSATHKLYSCIWSRRSELDSTTFSTKLTDKVNAYIYVGSSLGCVKRIIEVIKPIEDPEKIIYATNGKPIGIRESITKIDCGYEK